MNANEDPDTISGQTETYLTSHIYTSPINDLETCLRTLHSHNS